MKYKVIKLEGNKSILVDESAEIKEGARYLYDNNIIKSNGNNNDMGKKEWKECFKIVATINHSISLDVPIVIVKDYKTEELLDSVEHIAVVKAREKYSYSEANPRDTIDKMGKIKEYKEHFNDGVIEGYKAAQQKGVYSEEDMINLVQQIKDYTKEGMSILGNDDREAKKFVDIFTSSLKQEYIELDMERVSSIGVTDSGRERKFYGEEKIKTHRVNGQLMAYEKQKIK